MGKVVHKEMRWAVKQQSGALVHVMGDGSTSSVASVPEAPATTMTCALAKTVIYFAHYILHQIV